MTSIAQSRYSRSAIRIFICNKTTLLKKKIVMKAMLRIVLTI